MKRLLAILFMFLCLPAWSATYYVRTDGSNSASGANYTTDPSTGAWLTLTYAESQVTAGDIVRVGPGTYNEQPTCNVDGSSGNYIVFMAYDPDSHPVCRGFYFDGADYWKIIGIDVTHNSSSYNGAVQFNGTCSNIQILDCYFYNVRGRAGGEGAIISATGSASTSYITLRGNTMYWGGFVSGVSTNANNAVVSSEPTGTAAHWVVEYNTATRFADFFYTYGTLHTVRNNSAGDVSDSYWPGDTLPHTDIFQIGSDGTTANTSYSDYESNFAVDNSLADGHFFLQQNTSAGGDTDLLVRGNIMANFGSGPIGNISTPNLLLYNNTIYDICNVAASGSVYAQYGTPGGTGCLFANTIIHTDGNVNDIIAIDTGSATVVTNLGYNTMSHSSFVSTSDPLFTGPTSSPRDFSIGASSPARGVAANLIYITTAASTGTSFDVNNGKLLSDGRGNIDIEGDWLLINGTKTFVSSISGNTVTVEDSVTWGTNEVVYWRGDTGRDLGALPYGYTPLTAASIVQDGTTYTVTTTGTARGVWFYVDGIPTTWDYNSPFSATISSGTVTAKAYALYGQAAPVVTATASVAGSGTSGRHKGTAATLISP